MSTRHPPLDVKDLRFDTYRGDGSCVKVTHLPTGLEASKDASAIGVFRAREEAIHELKKKLAESLDPRDAPGHAAIDGLAVPSRVTRGGYMPESTNG